MKTKNRTKQFSEGGAMVAELPDAPETAGDVPPGAPQRSAPTFDTPLKARLAAAPQLKVPLASIRVGSNVRTDMNVDELVSSIRELGITTDLWVRPLPQYELQEPNLVTNKWRIVFVTGSCPEAVTAEIVGFVKEMEFTQENLAHITLNSWNSHQYELVAGGRRHKAATVLELAQVPVKAIDCSETEAADLQLAENLDREQLTPLDEAKAFRERVDSKRYGPTVKASVAALALQFSKSEAHIYDRMALLKLSPESREAFIAGAVELCLAKEISAVPGEKAQKAILAQHQITPFSVRHLRNFIAEKFLQSLENPVFDPSDDKLVTVCGSCLTCEHRTGNMLEAFPHLKSTPNVCTRPEFFKMKEAAHREVLLTEYRDKGFRVLTAKESKPIFEKWNPSAAARSSGWALANTVPADDAKERTLKQLGKLVDLKPAVCCDGNGKVVELFEVAPLTKLLLEQKIIKPPKEGKGERGQGGLGLGHAERRETEEERLERALQRETEKRFCAAAVASIVAIAQGATVPRGNRSTVVLGYMVCASAMNLETRLLYERRQWDGKMDLSDCLKGMDSSQMLGVLLEMHLSEYGGYSRAAIEELCQELDIDDKKLEKEIRAQVKEQFRLPKDGERLPAPKAEVERIMELNSCGCEDGKIKGVIELRGRRWVCQGGLYRPDGKHEASLLLLVPRSEYTGKCGTDEEINGHRDPSKETATNVGVIVSHAGTEFVQSKPEIEVVAEAPLVKDEPETALMADKPPKVAFGKLTKKPAQATKPAKGKKAKKK